MLNLDRFRDKRVMLAIIVMAMSFVGWKLALKQTWEAYQLHSNLSIKDQEGEVMAYNPAYLKQKNMLLDKIVQRYTIDSTAWKDEFWLRISRIAIKKQVNVEYRPQLQTGVMDTSSAVLKQHIIFEGEFKKLVGLLDTLQRTDNLGLITSANFKAVKNRGNDNMKKLYLEVDFSALGN